LAFLLLLQTGCGFVLFLSEGSFDEFALEVLFGFGVGFFLAVAFDEPDLMAFSLFSCFRSSFPMLSLSFIMKYQKRCQIL